MHDLLAQLGREIVRNVSTSEHLTREPGQRQFLVDARDICEVLSDDTAVSFDIGNSLHNCLQFESFDIQVPS